MGDDVKLRDLVSSLSVGQAWAVGGAALTVLGGTMFLGFQINEMRENEQLHQKNALLLTKSNEVNEKNNEIRNLKQELDRVKRDVTRTAEKTYELDQKAEFLNRYVSYLLSDRTRNENDNIAMKLFVDYVHAMWKDQQKMRTSFQYDREVIERIPNIARRVERGGGGMSGQEVDKFVYGDVIKIVSFNDGSRYQLPREIAIAVHKRPS